MYYFIYLSYFTDSYTIIYYIIVYIASMSEQLLFLSPYSAACLSLFLKCEFSRFDL
jgi:hypothetical protein